MILRAPRDDEFDALLELMDAHERAAFGQAEVTAELLRSWLTQPTVDVERDLRVLESGGRLVGYADVDPTQEEPPLWWCDVKIAPDADAGVTIGRLVAWLDERTGGGRLRVWSGAEDERVTFALRTLGFEPVRHSYRMEIELGDAGRLPRWPEAIAVRTVRDDEHRRLYDAVIEVWRDTSDVYDEPYESWRHWNVGSPAYDASLWFVAEAGDELAGFSFCRVDPSDPHAGHVGTLGVRRPWRQQGLGEALLLHSFAAFQERGYKRATLGVDASSPTGATRLYERAGMRIYRDTLFLERPVRG